MPSTTALPGKLVNLTAIQAKPIRQRSTRSRCASPRSSRTSRWVHLLCVLTVFCCRLSAALLLSPLCSLALSPSVSVSLSLSPSFSPSPSFFLLLPLSHVFSVPRFLLLTCLFRWCIRYNWQSARSVSEVAPTQTLTLMLHRCIKRCTGTCAETRRQRPFAAGGISGCRTALG